MLIPILFDGEEIIYPLTWQENHLNITTVNQTEDGHDHVTYTRKDKLRVSASWKCTDSWAEKFRAYAAKSMITMQSYDLQLKSYHTRTVRISDFSCSLVPHTYKLGITQGLWEINCTIEEY